MTGRLRPALLAAIATLAMVGCSSGPATPTPSPSSSNPNPSPTATGPGASQSPSATGTPTPSASGTGLVSSECQKANLATKTDGRLTIGTDNPAYPPWWGGTPPNGSDWSLGFPPSGQGFESAIASAVATALGYTSDEIDWTPVAFKQSYAPGPKPFDFYLAQVSYSAKRAQAVDMSDSYYDVNQALVALTSNPIASVTTVAGLKDFKLGAPVGTTSYDTITNVIQPSQDPSAFNDQNEAVKALKNGQIDGIVVDLPSAFYMRDAQLTGKNTTGVIVGQFPTPATGQEYFSLVLKKGSSLTSCVNEAIALIRSTGVWQSIYAEWLADKASAPAFQ